MAYIMSKFTNQDVYINIHTHSDFEIYIHELDSLNRFFKEDINKYENVMLYRSCDQTQ